jgi:hypothetical protein
VKSGRATDAVGGDACEEQRNVSPGESRPRGRSGRPRASRRPPPASGARGSPGWENTQTPPGSDRGQPAVERGVRAQAEGDELAPFQRTKAEEGKQGLRRNPERAAQRVARCRGRVGRHGDRNLASRSRTAVVEDWGVGSEQSGRRPPGRYSTDFRSNGSQLKILQSDGCGPVRWPALRKFCECGCSQHPTSRVFLLSPHVVTILRSCCDPCCLQHSTLGASSPFSST